MIHHIIEMDVVPITCRFLVEIEDAVMRYELEFIRPDKSDVLKISRAEPIPVPRKSEIVSLRDGQKDLGIFTVLEVIYFYYGMSVTAVIVCDPKPGWNDEPEADQKPTAGPEVVPHQVRPKKKRERAKRKP
jgi:hypothetical protein